MLSTTLNALLCGVMVYLAFLSWRGRVRSGREELNQGRSRALLIVRSIIFAFCALALLAACFVPFLVFFAACLAGIAVVLLWCVPAMRHRHGIHFRLAVLISLAAFGSAILQPLGLKVMLLPTAASLPTQPIPSRVLKTYDAGLAFEGIAAGSDGTLYLTGNRNLNFNVSDYYRKASGVLIARAPSGSERVLFQTPIGTTAGMIAVDADGTIFMTSHGEVSGVWKIGRREAPKMISRLPGGAWPNGIAFGPDGQLYSADSSLAAIWKIDPSSGHAAQVIADKALAARPFIALAPGANGIQFKGRQMIVTVSDSAEVLSYELNSAGHFGRAKVLAKGVPGDDFAINSDGSIFVTTHPYDTLVRIDERGKRTLVGDNRQHIVGATAAAFGRGTFDRATLYVVTDGGAFTKGPEARGQLVALYPQGQ
jgi:sugar lactone lactonase YvrE